MKNLFKKVIYGCIEMLTANEQGLSVLPILSGEVKGLKIRIDLQKDSAYFLGKYDRKLFTLIRKIHQPNWIFWDCGIYIGYYTMLFALLSRNGGGKVFSFEPDEENFLRAKDNIDLNNFTNVEFIKIAVADLNGELEFLIGGNTNSHLPIGWIGATPEDYKKIEIVKKKVKVKAATLDQMAQLYGVPNFVKIDIEGAELTALDHAKYLTGLRKTIFLVESHNPDTDRRIFNFAKDADFIIRNGEEENYPIVTSVEQSGGTMLIYPKEMVLNNIV